MLIAARATIAVLLAFALSLPFCSDGSSRPQKLRRKLARPHAVVAVDLTDREGPPRSRAVAGYDTGAEHPTPHVDNASHRAPAPDRGRDAIFVDAVLDRDHEPIWRKVGHQRRDRYLGVVGLD